MIQPVIPLEKLQTWSGLEAFYRAFEDLGYQAHRPFLDRVRSFGTEPELQASLTTYWEELAREALSSGEIWAYRGKHRSLPGFYRSPFLDQLEASLEPNDMWGHTPCVVHPLIARLRAAADAERDDPSIYLARYTGLSAKMKVAEYDRMGRSATEWDGKTKAFAAIFKEKALAAGFERGKPAGRFSDFVNSLWFCRPVSEDRLACIGYDRLGPLGLHRQLPLRVWLSLPGQPEAMGWFRLPEVIPGLQNYFFFGRQLYPSAYYNDMEEMGKCATIGIQAVIAAYSLLIESVAN